MARETIVHPSVWRAVDFASKADISVFLDDTDLKMLDRASR